jgi:hypothetical protein
MARVGAPIGNQNGAKSRRFEQAVERALLADDGKRLRAAAEKLLDLAAEGEKWAVEILRDTLDGKPSQSVSVDLTRRTVGDMDDPALAGIVASSGSSGVAGAQDGATQPAGLH